MNGAGIDRHPTVFISYSHDSQEHIDRVLALSNRLRDGGIDCVLDQYETSPPEGWIRWMDRNIRDADFVLMICTETYYRRVMLDERPGTGLGVKWEGKLIYQHIYQTDSLNIKFIPVLFEYCKPKHIPAPLQDATYHLVDTKRGYEDLYRRLTSQPRVERPKLGKLKKLRARERHPDFPIKINTAKLPSTSSALFGRDDELELLDRMWENNQTNVVILVAWAGAGKTAFVNYWLTHRMGPDNYRGAERVFGWSFYSQGAALNEQASSDQFIESALRFFGDTNPAEVSPWDKGIRLAELIKQCRTLLILDGLEPLQSPPGPDAGHVKYPAVRALLRNLAAQNPGLCVVTTRLDVSDLEDFYETSVKPVELEGLPPKAGADLLRSLGDTGSDKELERAASEYEGHALTLTLLGSYLKVVHGGDIRRRDEIGRLTDEQRKGKHACKVMAAYEKWFAGKPEIYILYMLGLFGGPADAGAITAVKAKPAIRWLTSELISLPKDKWQYALHHLREVHLLAPEDKNSPGTLDCHPLVREYFSDTLRTYNPSAWRQANNRLYKYYKSSAKKLPDTIEEMTPLYLAVKHGCHAGRYDEAYAEVFRARILRENEAFSIHKLGAYGADLVALTGFFDRPWDQPISGLSHRIRGMVLNHADVCLSALGRLAEAVRHCRVALEEKVAKKDWVNAAVGALNLSELYIKLGQLTRAEDCARQGIDFAGRSIDFIDDPWKPKDFEDSACATLAMVLHQRGRFKKAKELFDDAEQMQKRRPFAPSLLHSVPGFQYCDLLLDKGKYQQVAYRALWTLRVAKEAHALLDIALDHLSLGRAYLRRAQCENIDDLTQASGMLNRAVDELRKTGVNEFLAYGLLARAELYRVINDFVQARYDLDEAFELASGCNMRLRKADCYIGYVHLYLALNDIEKARENFLKAKELVSEIGYHRRNKELRDLERKLT